MTHDKHHNSDWNRRGYDKGRRAADRVWLLQPARRIWVGALFLLLCGLIAIQGIILVKYQDEQTRSHKTAVEAKLLAQEIQQQRVNSIRGDCEDQNRRHDNSIATFEQALTYYHHHPQPAVTKQHLENSIHQNIDLINALVPRQNCEALVKAAQR